MNRKILIIMVLLLADVLSGCKSNLLPGPREIDQFEMVQVVGIDKSKNNPDDVEVTFISRMKKGSSGKGQGGTQEITVVSSAGPSIFEAERKLKAHSEKMVFFGHVDYFLIGEEAAKEDFGKYFDFVNRDHEIRLSPKVYIIKDGTAKEFMFTTSTGERFIADRLKNLEFDIGILSNTDQVKIIDVSAMMDNTDVATIIPALKCDEIRDEKSNQELPEKDVCLGGYAVIKNFKLAGYIDDMQSLGYNFLVNKVKSCPITVKDASEHYVGLEVLNSKTKVEAHFNGDELEGVTYKTRVMSNVQEQQSLENIYTQDALEDLAAKQSAFIKQKVEQVISTTKEFKTDCTTLGEKIRMQHPIKWEKMKDKWKEIYPELKIEIEVKTQIERTYDIHQPNGYQGAMED